MSLARPAVILRQPGRRAGRGDLYRDVNGTRHEVTVEDGRAVVDGVAYADGPRAGRRG